MRIQACTYNISQCWGASLLRCFSACLLFTHLLTACTDRNADLLDQDSTQWPALQLSVQLGAHKSNSVATYGTADNTWFGNEEITVTAGDRSRPYLVQSDGSLTPGSEGALFWTGPDDMSVSAYYSPVEAITDHFHIETGQNQTVDSTTGQTKFDRSDALYAPPTTVKYGETANLMFHHLAAYVIVNITADSSVEIEDMSKASIKISNQHIESGEINLADGTVEQRTTAGTKSITPLSIGNSGTYKKAKALLVPQRHSGITFVTITFDGGSVIYSYIPTKAQPINLEAGKQYTLNLVLTKNHLVLNSQKINDWTVISDAITSTERDS